MLIWQEVLYGSEGKLNYVLDIYVQYVLFIIKIKMVFSHVGKGLLLVFSSSKQESNPVGCVPPVFVVLGVGYRGDGGIPYLPWIPYP